MKKVLILTAVFLLISPAAFAALIEDWSNVNPGKDAGTFADTLGSKIDFAVEAGPTGPRPSS